MKIQPIFPSFIGIEQINDLIDIKAIEDYCYKKERECVNQKWLGGWQSTATILDDPEMAPLISVVTDRLLGIKDMYGLKDEAAVRLCNGWININQSGNYGLNNNPPHLHANYFVSVVYYVKAEPKAGDLCLIAPFHDIEYTVPFSSIKNHTVYNSARWNITPEPGKLIIFPSWLMHYVMGNLSQSDRISIAFNTALPHIPHLDA
jgi:uncharacterized protein (TIGR02466 family)